jgi:hypothetical protein
VRSSGELDATSFDGISWATPAPLATGGVATVALSNVSGSATAVAAVQTTSDALETAAWSPSSSWSAPTQLHGDTTQGRPALVALLGAAAVGLYYWGNDYGFYSESFSNGAWTSASSAIIPTGMSSACGPNPGSPAPDGSGASFLFVNGNCGGAVNDLFETDYIGGTWTTPWEFNQAVPSYAANLSPALVQPEGTGGGPELLAVYIEQGTSQIYSMWRTNGTWSATTALPNATTNDPISLIGVNGGAVLAYRGLDSNLYAAIFISSLTSSFWGPPAAPFSTSVSIAAPPALARGVNSDTAEMVYIDASGAAQYASYIFEKWAAPAPIPGLTGLSQVAVTGLGQ